MSKMSEAKFTPGPWVLEYSTYAVNGVNWEVEGADGAHVAQNNFGGNDRETELANARLIAVAPELCEAAEEVLYKTCILECFSEKTGRCPYCKFAKLKAAVAKAKGGTE